MSDHILPKRTYYTIYVILLVCTYLTWQVAFFDLGAMNTVAALAIAVFKAAIVVLFFMHVKYSTRLTWVVVIGSVVLAGDSSRAHLQRLPDARLADLRIAVSY